MLTKEQISEIKKHLEKAQNPLFFFDNDPDGLCSFLLLSRYLNEIKGGVKGVAVKSFPELDESYFRKVHELKADYIFVLDKPVISNEFFKLVEQNNIPIVWIDHHELSPNFSVPGFVHYYNPLFNEIPSNEPTTRLCYQINDNKRDLWIAIVGCISDSFYPDFYQDFLKEYPDLCINSKDAFEIFYKSNIGKIAKIFSFALKDRTTNIISMIKFLKEVKTPYEVLEETKKNYTMHARFKQISQRYRKLIEKAKAVSYSGKLIFFQYGGDLSISSDLSNELIYLYPNKIVVVVYVSGIKANISIRGKNVKPIVLKAIEGLDDSSGGGHENAVGAKIKLEDIEKFREKILKLISD
ncbi:MAG: DHHA1 domain-containing protein [Nanoarchaeota archaeon]